MNQFLFWLSLSLLCLANVTKFFIGASESNHPKPKGNFRYFLPGSEVELQCFENINHLDIDSVSDCTWTRANEGDFSRNDLRTARLQDNYPMQGSTECSLAIRPDLYQVWNCSYTSQGQHFDGNSFIVDKGEELTKPKLFFNNREIERQISIKAGTPISLNCSVRALPPASISFQTEVLSLDEVGADNIRAIILKPQKNNNGKSVTCSAKQREYPQIPSKRITILLNVLFPPVSSSTKVAHVGDILRISFLFEANPEPSNATWRFSRSLGLEPKESVNSEVRFTPTEIKVKKDMYSGSLTIADPIDKDFETCFYLTVRNKVGEKTFETCSVSGNASRITSNLHPLLFWVALCVFRFCSL